MKKTDLLRIIGINCLIGFCGAMLMILCFYIMETATKISTPEKQGFRDLGNNFYIAKWQDSWPYVALSTNRNGINPYDDGIPIVPILKQEARSMEDCELLDECVATDSIIFVRTKEYHTIPRYYIINKKVTAEALRDSTSRTGIDQFESLEEFKNALIQRKIKLYFSGSSEPIDRYGNSHWYQPQFFLDNRVDKRYRFDYYLR